MSVYPHDDYREAIRQLMDLRRTVDGAITYQAMAEFMRVPKSYVSKVMGGGAHFSVDQVFLAARYLQLGDEEASYLQLLLDYARTGLAERRALLERAIRKIQSEKTRTEPYISAKTVADDTAGIGEYYLDPINQIVHICLSIPRYAKDLARLARDLNLSTARVTTAANRLESLGVVEKVEGSYKVLLRNIHLPKNSPVYRPWRTQLKLLSMQRMDAAPERDVYSFSVVFSTSAEARRKAHARLLEALTDIEKLVRESPQEETHQLSIDLFPWT